MRRVSIYNLDFNVIDGVSCIIIHFHTMLFSPKELGIECHLVQKITTWSGCEPDVFQSHELASALPVKSKYSDCVDH